MKGGGTWAAAFRRHKGRILTLSVAVGSPAATYLFDLRLAQVLGNRQWLDDFRILQSLQTIVVLASISLFPQWLVPKLVLSDLARTVRWDVIAKLQTRLIVGLAVLGALIIWRPRGGVGLLKAHSSHMNDPELLACTSTFAVSVLLTLATGTE